jgi:site-specific recombinase XerD
MNRRKVPMRSPELSRIVTDFFLRHLSAERNVSRHTTLAYRDALKLFLRFAADWHKRPVDHLAIGDLTPEVVLTFLDSLETARHNTVRTRNARLAAIHCFFRYVLDCEPSHAALCQRILVIPVKKAVRPSLGYLSDEELGNLLSQVDRSTREGRRDYLLLALLYDTGTRIQELLDVTPADFHLTNPAFVRVLGKGKKERLCPLLPQTARVVSRFIEAEEHHTDDRRPLFGIGVGRS